MIETIVCSSLRDARALVARQELELIFCEESLPDGPYSDLLTVVRERTRKIPVVVVISDANRDRTHREAMEQGAFEVIANPCSRQDVQWAMIRAMDLTRSPRTAQRTEN